MANGFWIFWPCVLLWGARWVDREHGLRVAWCEHAYVCLLHMLPRLGQCAGYTTILKEEKKHMMDGWMDEVVIKVGTHRHHPFVLMPGPSLIQYTCRGGIMQKPSCVAVKFRFRYSATWLEWENYKKDPHCKPLPNPPGSSRTPPPRLRRRHHRGARHQRSRVACSRGFGNQQTSLLNT